ncbi:cysteine dioxygenase type 1 isoform X1 [Diabrotica undecimpunctata]|uniref:cysteine dioxygenase type 1 isoform X1 n=1 Tax=Diabrotica undecimpunctata TaxID=50387 RepID=UPI003B633AD4
MEVCKYINNIGQEHRDDDDFDVKFYKEMGNNLPVINSLDDLIKELRLIFESDKVNIDLVSYVMKSYKSCPADWKKYAKFDRFSLLGRSDADQSNNSFITLEHLGDFSCDPLGKRYTRNLVDAGNGKYNLMAVCWGEGHGSAIHDHANSHCFMKMLQGSLEEIRFAWPKTQGEQLREIGRTRLEVNDCAYINDSIGLHRVENVSSVDTAISLHLYCPPYSKCQVFNQNTGNKSTANVTFYSAFGKRIRENKEIVEPEDN